MAFRLYIVPVVGTGTRQDPREAKYFADGTLANPTYNAVDYGFEPWMVVGADLSVSDDALVIGQADAFGIPFDLNATLTSQQVNGVQNKLEAINVPAGWVNTSLQWITVVRIVLGMFSFIQRASTALSIARGIAARIFNGGVSLGTTFNQLPADVRTALQDTAAALNLDTSGITGTTTLRNALKNIADQFSTMRYTFGDVTL